MHGKWEAGKMRQKGRSEKSNVKRTKPTIVGFKMEEGSQEPRNVGGL